MINFQDNLENITPENLQGFFVGWPNPPSQQTHLEILKNSSYFIVAVDSKSGMVVGFINSISDNIMSAYIPLLEVLPEYQKQGIGGKLVRKIVDHYKNLYMLDLTCDENLQKYYEKQGLKKSSGMMIRNFDRQNCA